MYEPRHVAPLSRRAFARRMAWHLLAAGLLVGVSLLIGCVAFLRLEGLSLPEALLNTCMLLSGMGVVHTPATPAGALFTGLYALYAGLLFVATAGILLAPVTHRLLHTFHWGAEQS